MGIVVAGATKRINSDGLGHLLPLGTEFLALGESVRNQESIGLRTLVKKPGPAVAGMARAIPVLVPSHDDPGKVVKRYFQPSGRHGSLLFAQPLPGKAFPAWLKQKAIVLAEALKPPPCIVAFRDLSGLGLRAACVLSNRVKQPAGVAPVLLDPHQSRGELIEAVAHELTHLAHPGWDEETVLVAGRHFARALAS